MKIGESIVSFSNNLLNPYSLGITENGITVDIPAGLNGKVLDVKDKTKTGHTVFVDLKYNDVQSLKVYMKPSALKTMTQ